MSTTTGPLSWEQWRWLEVLHAGPASMLIVDDELSFDPVEGIDFFRSRRPFCLLFAGYEAPVRAAHGVLAATVQQWLTTPARLQEWIELLRPLHVPDRRTADAAPAASSNRPCRATPLTDCEWNLPDGTKIVLEVATSIRGWPPT